MAEAMMFDGRVEKRISTEESRPKIYSEIFPSLPPRYYSSGYVLDAGNKTSEDHCVTFQANRYCLVTLAPSHPVLKEKKKIVKIDYRISAKLDRSKNKVTKKGKRGPQYLQESSPLCFLECTDGSKYTIYSCVKGKLMEVNENLIENPNLLTDESFAVNFVAMILADPAVFARMKHTMLTPLRYREAVANREAVDNRGAVAYHGAGANYEELSNYEPNRGAVANHGAVDNHGAVANYEVGANYEAANYGLSNYEPKRGAVAYREAGANYEVANYEGLSNYESNRGAVANRRAVAYPEAGANYEGLSNYEPNFYDDANFYDDDHFDEDDDSHFDDDDDFDDVPFDDDPDFDVTFDDVACRKAVAYRQEVALTEALAYNRAIAYRRGLSYREAVANHAAVEENRKDQSKQ